MHCPFMYHCIWFAITLFQSPACVFIWRICCFSVSKWCPTVCDCMGCSTPGFPVLHYLLEFAQTHAHSDSIISSCHPILLPSIFPSIRVVSNESTLCIRWPKYWSFSVSISSSNEYSVLISFRMDLFDLLAVQGTLESLLQHHSSKASILRRAAFFIVHIWLLGKHSLD